MIPDLRVPRILVTGARGQLGSELVKILSKDYRLISAGRAEFDITNLKETVVFIDNVSPEVIIHAAAFTDVDGAELQQDKAFDINAMGTKNVALGAKKVDARLFYISTDYVFDGTKEGPYVEDDKPNPLNVYGKSKLLGENFVREICSKFFIIRTAWLYGSRGKNFVKRILSLAREKEELEVVNDQQGTPAYTVDLARQIKKLLPQESYGIYHCTSQGSCTWYEFALEILKYAGYEIESARDNSVRLISPTQDQRSITIKSVTTEKLSPPARRPENSVLENHMLKLQGLDIMPHWKKSLKEFIMEQSVVWQ